MLDTNICIYLMKHQPPQVRAKFADCFVGDVVISAITLAELEYGVATSGNAEPSNRAALESLFDDIVIAPFDDNAASAYGPVRAANRSRQRDALIASHAIAMDVTLVTNNEADFQEYAGLRIENWARGH